MQHQSPVRRPVSYTHLDVYKRQGYDKKLKTWRMEDLPMMPERFKLVVIPQTRGQFQAVKSLIERKDVAEIIIATEMCIRDKF